MVLKFGLTVLEMLSLYQHKMKPAHHLKCELNSHDVLNIIGKYHIFVIYIL